MPCKRRSTSAAQVKNLFYGKQILRQGFAFPQNDKTFTFHFLLFTLKHAIPHHPTADACLRDNEPNTVLRRPRKTANIRINDSQTDDCWAPNVLCRRSGSRFDAAPESGGTSRSPPNPAPPRGSSRHRPDTHVKVAAAPKRRPRPSVSPPPACTTPPPNCTRFRRC